jgi:hypothetical protein
VETASPDTHTSWLLWSVEGWWWHPIERPSAIIVVQGVILVELVMTVSDFNTPDQMM